MTSKIESALRTAAGRLPDAGAPEAVAQRAAAEGLLDVAYATVDSPLGPLVLHDSRARGPGRVVVRPEQVVLVGSDTEAAIGELLARIRRMSERQLREQVYARRLHVLCARCQTLWLADPFGLG